MMDENSELSAADKVGRALVHMVRRAEEAQEQAARVHGLHPTDFRCIGYLENRNDRASPKDIAAFLGLTSGAVTALLDRMDKAGFIQRVPNPDDRRGVLIVLDTEAAAGPLSHYRGAQERYAAATSEFSEADLEVIAKYLTQVSNLTEMLNESLYPPQST